MKVAIIGGGPAGLVASILAKNDNNEVFLFDKNNDFGKKLLLTGNGKCNYWNENQSISKYHSNNSVLLNNVITKDNLNNTKKFLDDLGIISFDKNGWLYPFSNISSSIKSILVNTSRNKGVIFKNNCEILKVEKKDKFRLFYANGFSDFDSLVIATGSCCYPKTGSNGWGYDVARLFNLNIVDVKPSLVQLISNSGLEKKWAGIRTNVSIKYKDQQEDGELQLTDYGISGICVFNISRNISRNINARNEVIINFVPWFKGNINEFYLYLDNISKKISNCSISQLCDGFLNYKLVNIFLDFLKINHDLKWNEIEVNLRKKFVHLLFDFHLEIVGTKGFECAQVCSGGISLLELNLKNFETLKIPNLYFCGEVIDVDGDCGGYNLSFAFLSGFLVGSDIFDKSKTS